MDSPIKSGNDALGRIPDPPAGKQAGMTKDYIVIIILLEKFSFTLRATTLT